MEKWGEALSSRGVRIDADASPQGADCKGACERN